MTTRKRPRPSSSAPRLRSLVSGLSSLVPGLLSLLLLSGCSTPGPVHAYLGSRPAAPIHDILDGVPQAELSTWLSANNPLYGFAYDPYTDHLFLRVYPGNFVRVVDRPAGKIKRDFIAPGLPAGPGDLTVRSRDRHVFFAHPSEPAIVETTLHGALIRSIDLAGLHHPPAGIAYDQKANRLLVLVGGDLARVVAYDLDGRRLGGVALDRNVRLASLAYDSAAAEFYVPLLDEPAVGVFDARGHFVRAIPSPSGESPRFVDVGQRSLLRLF